MNVTTEKAHRSAPVNEISQGGAQKGGAQLAPAGQFLDGGWRLRLRGCVAYERHDDLLDMPPRARPHLVGPEVAASTRAGERRSSWAMTAACSL